MIGQVRPNEHLILYVIGLRLRWYLWYTMRLLRRHWQWFVIATLLLPMGMGLPDIIDLLAWPVVTIVDPSKTWLIRLSVLVLFQVIAVLWIFAQRWQIIGSSFSEYLQSLPISAATRVLTDVVVLLVATSFALLPFAVGIALSSKTPLTSTTFTVLYLVAAASVLTLTQLLVLRQRWLQLASTLIFVTLLAASIAFDGTLTSWLILLVVFTGTALEYYIVCIYSYKNNALRSILSPTWAKPSPTSSSFLSLRSSRKWFLLTHMMHLLWDDRASILPRLFGAFGVCGFAVFLAVQFAFDTRTDALVLITATASTVLLAGIYTVINRARANTVEYMNTLPSPLHIWGGTDILTVIIISLMPASVYGAILITSATPAIDICMILGIQCLLLITLRPILLAKSGHTVAMVASACIASVGLTLLLM